MTAPDHRQTLVRYPFPVVRVACRYCAGRGQYRLERLITLYGSDAAFDDVLIRLAADCTRVES